MTAEEIVRALAVCQRGSEQAYDLAGEAAKWVAEHDDTSAPWPPPLDPPKSPEEAALRERNIRAALAPFTCFNNV